MTKPTSPKFQTLRSQRDELAAIYDSQHGARASKRLFEQKLGANKNLLKHQVNLLCEFMTSERDPSAAPKASSNRQPAANFQTKRVSPGEKMTRATFNALPPAQQSKFCLAGGKLVN
jgi:hypothetical protein